MTKSEAVAEAVKILTEKYDGQMTYAYAYITGVMTAYITEEQAQTLLQIAKEKN